MESLGVSGTRSTNAGSFRFNPWTVMIKAGRNTNYAVIPVVQFAADNPKHYRRRNGKDVQFIELSIAGIHGIEMGSPEIHAFLQAILKEFPEKY